MSRSCGKDGRRCVRRWAYLERLSAVLWNLASTVAAFTFYCSRNMFLVFGPSRPNLRSVFLFRVVLTVQRDCFLYVII
jgi:hypothetical protein